MMMCVPEEVYDGHPANEGTSRSTITSVIFG